jgi:hypothetical protein
VHEHVCLYWDWVLLQKKIYKDVFFRYIESITQAL